MKKIIIKADIDHSELVEKNTYDVAAIRINAVDEYNNILPYFNDVVSFETQGAIELIGPSVTSFHGGMGGTYIRTTGRAGSGRLIIRSAQAEDVNVEVDVRIGKGECV
jgi:beta-galactosidase